MKVYRTVVCAGWLCCAGWSSAGQQAAEPPPKAAVHKEPVPAAAPKPAPDAKKKVPEKAEPAPARVKAAPPAPPPPPPLAEQKPVQPLEERSDAMLFDICALNSVPFDLPVILPFERL